MEQIGSSEKVGYTAFRERFSDNLIHHGRSGQPEVSLCAGWWDCEIWWCFYLDNPCTGRKHAVCPKPFREEPHHWNRCIFQLLYTATRELHAQYQANVDSEYVSCWLHTIINRKASFSNSFHGLGESSFDLILMSFSNASSAGPFTISSFPDCSLLFLMPSRCNWLS